MIHHPIAAVGLCGGIIISFVVLVEYLLKRGDGRLLSATRLIRTISRRTSVIKNNVPESMKIVENRKIGDSSKIGDSIFY